MTAASIMKQLKSLGADSYKSVILKHGIKEPVFGVRISELKKIEKKVGRNYQLSLDLFETKNYDAQYLAGLIADETKMTREDLRRWLATSNCRALCGTAVAWVAAESSHGHELAMEWIESKDETVAQTGWQTLSNLVAIKDDADLDVAELKRLLLKVEKTIHQRPDAIRYAMNGFVIAVGGYVRELTDQAIKTAEKIGVVEVDMGDTDCKVPFAPDYIRKIQRRGSIGKKRKSARC